MLLPSPAPADTCWILITLALTWCGATGVFAQIPGWRGLAKRFRAVRTADGKRFGLASAVFCRSTGLHISYRRCLFFTVGDTGLHVSILLPFRFLAPPLFIPWTAVESATNRRFWSSPYLALRIRGCPTLIMVSGQPGEAIGNVYARFAC